MLKTLNFKSMRVAVMLENYHFQGIVEKGVKTGFG